MFLLLLLLLLLLLYTFYHIIITSFNCQEKYTKRKNISKKKGICYFDIDDTLTTATGNIDNLVKKCIDNDFAVGIITASSRKLEHICDGPKSKHPWMPDLLCKQFNQNPALYNSSVVLSGKTRPTPTIPYSKYGMVKAHDMEYCRNLHYPHIHNKCLVLFDDQKQIISNVKIYNNELETQCSSHNPEDPSICDSLGKLLDAETVENKVKSMIKNGCS
jgi:hypothetical protein